jgi:hypothetical protein
LDNFRYIIVELPSLITMSYIINIRSYISKISIEDSLVINSQLNLNIEDISVDKIEESDLFHLGEDALKVKKAVHTFLNEAVGTILVPRINCHLIAGDSPGCKGFGYFQSGDKTYAISGDQISQYRTVDNLDYRYLLALNISGILSMDSHDDIY